MTASDRIMRVKIIREQFLTDLENRVNIELDDLKKENHKIIDTQFLIHTSKTIVAKEEIEHYYFLIIYE